MSATGGMMLAYRPITQCAGKQIRAVVDGFECVLLTFTDATYTMLRVDPGYDGDAGSVISDEWRLGEGRVSDDDAVAAGVLTADELAALRASRDEKNKADREAWERQQYERLRAKFGPSDSASGGHGA